MFVWCVCVWWGWGVGGLPAPHDLVLKSKVVWILESHVYLLVEHFNRDGVCLVVTQKVYSDTKYPCAKHNVVLKCTPSPTPIILNQDEGVGDQLVVCQAHTYPSPPPPPSNPHRHGTSTLVPAIMSTSGVPLLQWSVLVRCLQGR